MHRFSRLIPSLAVLAVFAGQAQAHPGHAMEIVSPSSGWHYLLQPEHASVMCIALAACGAAAYMVYRRRTARLTPATVRRHG